MRKSFTAIVIAILLVVTTFFCLTACEMLGGQSGNNGGNGSGGSEGAHTEHVYSDWNVVINPTCTTPGIRERYCECGERESEPVDELGHDYVAVVTGPSCTEDGYTTYTCSRCPSTYREAGDPQLGHYFVDGICERCGAPIEESRGLSFALNSDDTYTVSGYNGSDANVIILAEHEGKPVVAIGERAFSYNQTATSVLMPDSIKEIKRNAFSGSKITSIEIPASAEKIEDSAFYGSLIESVTFATDGSLTSIGEYAFEDCKALTAVTVPEGVNTIGMGAFEGCDHITALSLPSTLKQIGTRLVSECDRIETLTIAAGNPVYTAAGNSIIKTATKTLVVGSNATVIPADGSVTKIGEYAFYGCDKLTALAIPSQIKSIERFAFPEESDIEYNLYEGGKYLGNEENAYMVFVGLIDDSVETITLAAGVKMVGPSAFERNNLHTVIIPEGVETICARAFAYNGALESITIPASVKHIEEYAFGWCRTAATLSFADGSLLENIGEGAFMECAALETVCVPEGVSSVALDAFRNSPIKNATISAVAINAVVNADNQHSLENVVIEGGGVIERESFRNATNLRTVRILSGVTEIGGSAFSNKENLVSVEIGAEVRKIGDSAFYYCPELTTITFAANSHLEEFGDSVFNYCDNLAYNDEDGVRYLGAVGNDHFILIKPLARTLTSFTVNENTKVIFNEAFQNMPLTSVSLPDGLQGIERSAFLGCSALTSVTIPESVTFIGKEAFFSSGLESVTIPAGVKTINQNTFFRNKNLQTVNFAEGSVLESIGRDAFEGCTALRNISIPSSVKSIDGDIFEGCTALEYTQYENGKYLGNSENPYLILVKVDDKAVTTFTIHEKTKIIYTSAFQYCTEMTSVSMPSGITDIGALAFARCIALRSIVIPEGVTALKLSVFNSCSSLRFVTIPANVEIIDTYAFSECTALESVTFAEGSMLTFIGEQAFYKCGKLASFVMPSKLQHIGASAFAYCSSLTNLAFPATFSEMDSGNSFAYCSGLETITVEEGNDAFFAEGNCLIKKGRYGSGSSLILGCKNSVIPGNANIYYIYKSAFQGCTGLTSIVIPYGVYNIDNFAFDGCYNLVSIDLPGDLSSIANYAFGGCYKLVEIHNRSMYLTLTAGSDEKGEIAKYAKNIYTPNNGESKLSVNEDGYVLYTDDEDVILVAYNGEESALVLPADVTKIERYALSDGAYESVSIPATVQEIGDHAFMNLTALESIVYDGTSDEWLALPKDVYWDSNTGEYIVRCSDAWVSKSGALLD